MPRVIAGITKFLGGKDPCEVRASQTPHRSGEVQDVRLLGRRLSFSRRTVRCRTSFELFRFFNHPFRSID